MLCTIKANFCSILVITVNPDFNPAKKLENFLWNLNRLRILNVNKIIRKIAIKNIKKLLKFTADIRLMIFSEILSNSYISEIKINEEIQIISTILSAIIVPINFSNGIFS